MAKAGIRRALIPCTFLLMTISQWAMSQVNVSIRGVIVAPPSCIINGGTTLHVPFGNDMMTTRVDGTNYRKGVPYTVLCTGGSSNNMTLKVQGSGTSFDTSILRTSNDDLGVKLYINNAVWNLNTSINFTYPTLPVMEAVPVKRPASTLHAGVFTASATLVVAMP